MERSRLAHAPDEYRQLFQFFFTFRAIALSFGLIWILFKLTRGENLWAALVILAVAFLYTAIIYTKRFSLFALLLKHPVYLGVDVLLSVFLLAIYPATNSPFYFYSISPVIPAGVMFRFKGATLSSSFLALGQIVSLLLHDFTARNIFSVNHFPILFGQIAAYYTVGYLCIYPADMIAEIVRQSSLIKEKTEKEAIAEERTRLSRELHDNLAQILSAINLRTDTFFELSNEKAIDSARQIRDLATAALQDLRNAIFALRPENVEQDLSSMLTDFCRRFSSAAGCKIDTCLTIDGADLSYEKKYEILRICQEALTNASRHSGTGTVKLKAEKGNHKLMVNIEDSGIGFNTSGVHTGVGISSMRERAAKLGGSLEIFSVPGAGTKVTLTLPLRTVHEKNNGTD